MQLIDRSALKEAMMRYGFTAPDMTVHEFVEDELPTVDAVKVVRCKNCRNQLICYHSDNYFCSGGERKDDEQIR